MRFWKRGGGQPAVATPLAEMPPDPKDITDAELLDAIAGRVVRMRLAVPAIFFLESTKPLSFVGSQVLVFLEPFVQAFLTVRHYERFTRMMEDRRNVEKLIQRVEALDEEERIKEKRERAERKRRKAEHRSASGGTTVLPAR